MVVILLIILLQKKITLIIFQLSIIFKLINRLINLLTLARRRNELVIHSPTTQSDALVYLCHNVGQRFILLAELEQQDFIGAQQWARHDSMTTAVIKDSSRDRRYISQQLVGNRPSYFHARSSTCPIVITISAQKT